MKPRTLHAVADDESSSRAALLRKLRRLEARRDDLNEEIDDLNVLIATGEDVGAQRREELDRLWLLELDRLRKVEVPS